ncbi:hypothetical protein ONZ43_g775 [Nemania bipapillata]|uniref:Uncharacterized protein n=1 Tax=Nemania bipapillata TaxID=110536 RepID=A0ACC2J739_9PEZI|nr:hypothetical protein ONZ43_g775 [Nemania bipapillata]
MATYRQFAAFSNDTAGLERIFRLLQSWVQIILAYPSVISTVCQLQSNYSFQCIGKFPTRSTLLVLQQRLDIARRYIRVFRFLSVFQKTQELLTRPEHVIVSSPNPEKAANTPSTDRKVEGSSPTPSPPASPRQLGQAEKWLDSLSLTLTGMYLLTETSTVIDYMQVDGLQVWGPTAIVRSTSKPSASGSSLSSVGFSLDF